MSEFVSMRCARIEKRHTLWLQVSVDKTHQMEVFQGGCDFSRIEACGILIDTLVWSCLQRSEELTTTTVFHAEVKMILGLERVV